MQESRAIKALFFDFDGVLTIEKRGTPTMLSYLAKETGLPYEKIKAAYMKYSKALLLGEITHREMWKPFCEELGRDLPFALLEKSFLNMTLDQRILQTIREKKGQYRIGMITDNKADRIAAIVEQTELKGLFDYIIISADVHSRKSEKKIFEEALRQAGLEARNCVFIDNTAANLVQPAEMGFVTVYFDADRRDYDKLIF